MLKQFHMCSNKYETPIYELITHCEPLLSSQSKKVTKIGNRYNQVAQLTKDITWESDINTIKHNKREPRGQPFPSR